MNGRALRTLFFFAPAVALLAAHVACNSTSELVAAGGDCFLASDCAPGLICVPQKSGARVCSADLSQVVGRPPPDGGGGGDGGDASDAEAADGGEDTGTPDTGTPDTGKPDTGSPDTGAPDTGSPTDSGTD